MPAEYDTNRMTQRQRKDLNRSKLLHDLAIPFLIVGMAASLIVVVVIGHSGSRIPVFSYRPPCPKTWKWGLTGRQGSDILQVLMGSSHHSPQGEHHDQE
jgi:hypothetical protein